MQNDHNTADTIQAGPEHPEIQAREVVEAMRARGMVTPEVAQALTEVGRQHAHFVGTVQPKEKVQ